MSFIYRLVIKNMKARRARTLFNIFGLSIATILIVSSINLILITMQSSYNNSVEYLGAEDFQVYNLDDKGYEYLNTRSGIKQIYKYNDHLSYIDILNERNTKELLNINFYKSDKYFLKNILSEKLIEGKMPDKPGQALAPYTYKISSYEGLSKFGRLSFDAFNKELVDGIKDTIIMSDQDKVIRVVEDFQNDKNRFIESFLDKSNLEINKTQDQVDIEIVGYYSDNSSTFKLYESNGEIVESTSMDFYIYDNVDTATFNVKGNFIDNISSSQAEKILIDLIDHTTSEQTYYFMNQDSFLQAFTTDFSLGVFSENVIFILLLILGLMLIFIYNISVSNVNVTSTDLGLYRALGMTRVQLFKYIIIESMILFFISYILGFIFGTSATNLVYLYIKSNLNETISGIFIRVSRYDVFLSFITSFILSFLSTIILQIVYYKNIIAEEPANLLKAKSYNQIKIKRVNLNIIKSKVSFNTYISIKNILSRRKKYFIDTLAISMCLIAATTIVISSFDFGFNIFERLGKPNYNYGVIGSEDMRNTQDIINDLENIAGIKAENKYSIIDGIDILYKGIRRSSKILVFRDDEYSRLFGGAGGLDEGGLLVYLNKEKNDLDIGKASISLLLEDQIMALDGLLYEGKLDKQYNHLFEFEPKDINLIMPLGLAKDLYSYDKNSQVIVNDFIELSNNSRDDNINYKVSAVISKYSSTYVESYEQAFIKVIRIVIISFFMLLIVVSILNAINTNYNRAHERTRQIALYRALGMEKSSLFRIFKMEDNIIISSSIIVSLIAIIIGYLHIKYGHGIEENFALWPVVLVYLTTVLINIIISKIFVRLAFRIVGPKQMNDYLKNFD